MLVIIDMLGDEDTVVVGDDEKQIAAQKAEHDRVLREIADRAPQPTLQIITDK